MARLAVLTSAYAQPVWVNPETVRFVQANGKNATIYFAGDHSLVVTESPQEVANKLELAM